MEWRLIESAALPGAANMAIDQALFESAQAGGPPSLRLYRWDPACLSLGRNQPVSAAAVLAAATADGIDVVRRPTGGSAVLHDRELTYSVAVPVGVLGSPRESYLAINRALVAGLRRLGVAAEVADAATAPLPAPPERRGDAARTGGRVEWLGPCFQAAAPGEVVVGGRKLVGSAQRCERRTLLQHGSLLLEGGQNSVAELLGGEAALAGAAAPFVTLAELGGEFPSWSALVSVLRAGFEETLGIRLAPGELSLAEAARARALTAHFASAAWTWRR